MLKNVCFRFLPVLLIAVIFLCCFPLHSQAASQYTVTYDANGGANAPAAQVQNIGVALTLSSTKPTRSGYIFQGWADSAYGEPTYQPGGIYARSADITLYAVWTLKCKTCGGDGSVDKTCSTCNGDGYYYKRYSKCCDYSVSETIGAYGTIFYQCRYCWSVCQTTTREITCDKTVPATCTSCAGRGWDRASQPTAPAPELSSVTETSITVTALPNVVYSIDNGSTWQHSNTFSNLTPGTTYIIVQCYVGGTYYDPGPASAGLYISTKKYTQSAPDVPTLHYAESTYIELNSVNGCEYSMDGANWQHGTTFYNLQPDTAYTFYQRKYNTSTHDASPSSPGLTVTTTGIGSLVVGQVTGSPGDTVTVDVTLESSPHFTYLGLYLDFDNTKLEFVELKNGTVFNSCNHRIYHHMAGSRIQVYLEEDYATANNTKTGVLASVTFKIRNSAGIGTGTITPIIGSAHNINARDVELSVRDGGVTVSCGSHQFGGYTGNDSVHWKVCSKCQYRTETEAHKYDHDCDQSCNICQQERETSHYYEPRSDETGHWAECIGCKDLTEVAAHVPGEEATKDTAQLCILCNYIIKPALSHSHEYDPNWTMNVSAHWHTCSGCEEKDGYGEHRFDNDCDTDCADCGYTRKTEHTYAEEWSADEASHYHVCSACGEKKDEAAHTFGASQVCTVCNYEFIPAPTDETADKTGVTDNVEKPVEEHNNFPWWIVIIVVVAAAAGGSVVFVILKKKKS